MTHHRNRQFKHSKFAQAYLSPWRDAERVASVLRRFRDEGFEYEDNVNLPSKPLLRNILHVTQVGPATLSIQFDNIDPRMNSDCMGAVTDYQPCLAGGGKGSPCRTSRRRTRGGIKKVARRPNRFIVAPMTHDLIDYIRTQQTLLPEGDAPPPEHKPQMLLIGCVDARLNPRNDLGIPDGAAIIHRNIAAMVRSRPDPGDIAGTGVAASLEFAINVMGVKHIVVMGHTDCGGIRACLEDNHTHDTQSIRKYLTPLAPVREEVVAQGGDIRAQARAMEQAAVRQSVENLMSYEVVQNAIAADRLRIHGWVINTGTKRILELDIKSGKFAPMSA